MQLIRTCREATRGPARHRTALAAAAFALLAGCVQAGPVRAPETALPAAFEANGGPLPAQALDQWWLQFNDAQLTQLIEAALARSTDAREAAARLAEARAIRRGALNAYDPQGNLVGNAQAQQTQNIAGGESSFEIPGLPEGDNPFNQTGVIYQGNLNFDVSWEVDLFGRRGAARTEAQGQLAAARFAYEGSRASIAANVADSLFALRGLAIQLDDARESRRIQARIGELTRIRSERGLSPSSDVDRIETDLAQAEAEVTRLEAEEQASRRALLVLTGDPIAPTATLPVSTSLGALPPVPTSLPSELLARRPDVRQASAELAAASGRLRLDELAFFPRFTLNPGIGLTGQQGGIIDVASFVWTAAAGLTAPILDRPRLISQLRAQEARVEQAVVGYERAVQTAFSESDQVLVRLNADRRRVATLQRGHEQARRAYAAAETGYARGLTDLTSLLDAERQLRSARTAVTGAEVQALRRTVQAYKALGGGWNMAGAAPLPARPDTPPTPADPGDRQ